MSRQQWRGQVDDPKDGFHQLGSRDHEYTLHFSQAEVYHPRPEEDEDECFPVPRAIWLVGKT